MKLNPACREMTELATDYLEGSLPMSKTALVRLHLMLCAHCGRYYAQMGAVRDLSRDLTVEASSQEIVEIVDMFRSWRDGLEST